MLVAAFSDRGWRCRSPHPPVVLTVSPVCHAVFLVCVHLRLWFHVGPATFQPFTDRAGCGLL
jgi:hypothetical protein